jgi:hypothetical protein
VARCGMPRVGAGVRRKGLPHEPHAVVVAELLTAPEFPGDQLNRLARAPPSGGNTAGATRDRASRAVARSVALFIVGSTGTGSSLVRNTTVGSSRALVAVARNTVSLGSSMASVVVYTSTARLPRQGWHHRQLPDLPSPSHRPHGDDGLHQHELWMG